MSAGAIFMIMFNFWNCVWQIPTKQEEKPQE